LQTLIRRKNVFGNQTKIQECELISFSENYEQMQKPLSAMVDWWIYSQRLSVGGICSTASWVM